MPIQTIVAALALETDSDPVALRAFQLARQHGARLIFVHVVEDAMSHDAGLPGPADASSLRQILEQDATEQIRRLMGNLGSDMTAEIVVDAGKPFQIIDQIAQRNHAGLIVIGPGKARNIREKVFGSTADRIVRSSTRPVLVVRLPAPGPYERVAVAVDFSASSKAATRAAVGLAPDAAIELVHAVEVPLGFELAMLKSGTPQVEIGRYRRAKARDAQATERCRRRRGFSRHPSEAADHSGRSG